ncbi:MAG TPA: SDR family oxidoreductase [Flavobacteriaceae bacterium]|nr:SDR family oxidoreductase [Flavobacteriaceae bacterium]HPF10597.1 SDR family oxidoreductase [Flavobacteriaceae bacterium]HQU20879.1 SDR family oxidoreductase [Flavobacteriaceae bacterium]HQU64363.1 SDR family oxidoreductase [Flavobacteriaceae bacterium]HRW43288.1 SDR family oxidoreductase [Flavobacteriaceae bacterium]
MKRKTILLVGGSYGIGQSLAQLLIAEHRVIVASRTQGHLPPNCEYLPFDALNDDVASLQIPDKLDGLVYCPGSINLKPFHLLKPNDFLQDLELNFLGLVKTTQALLPKLKQSEQASLVFFSTVAVQSGMPFHTSIAAAKGAVEGFAKSLAAEYAPKFRVNVIAPSLTDTPLASKLLSSQDKKEKMATRHPLNRIGSSLDIAQMAAFLLSDNASWITGQTVAVDGGMGTLKIPS